MAYAEKRGTYWRGRYKAADGTYATVVNELGGTVRFPTRREAEKAADDAEAKVRSTPGRSRSASRTTFADYVNRWYARLDLAASTMQNYRRHIEEHLLPFFEATVVSEISHDDVLAWERKEKQAGYAPSSIKTWRGTLHLILADTIEDGLRDSNPAARRRGRGRRDGHSRHRGPEKAVTDALGILLIAERAALLAGRDDEFVAIITMGFTGMRWGEIVGLETGYARAATIRVEWQLYELDNGELHRCPPKDGSRRSIDIPQWHGAMLATHINQTAPKPCACHGLTYVFRGLAPANGSVRHPGPRIVDVARRAAVSTGTVSAVLNDSPSVAAPTRDKVQAAIAELGYVRGWNHGELAAHWRRNGFTTWLFHPAATGWYPPKAPQPARPVPILAEPWPGIPVRGRGGAGRADSCWLPIAKQFTPHSLRHSHKTLMDELGVPPKLMDERMGHDDGSVQARYSHVTAEMRRRLMADLTRVWQEALQARRRLSESSPVSMLDHLLRPN